MVIRIALQCNEADAYLIMDEDNPAPRLLSRPGEGIYNDAAGTIEGNSPFQVVWLPDEVRDDYLAKVRERADQSARSISGTIRLRRQRAGRRAGERAAARGCSNEPAVSRRAPAASGSARPIPSRARPKPCSSGRAATICSSSASAKKPRSAIVAVALISLAAQYPRGASRFVVFDSTPPGTSAARIPGARHQRAFRTRSFR